MELYVLRCYTQKEELNVYELCLICQCKKQFLTHKLNNLLTNADANI